jgi:4-amino-4-deoxy-L-arabinose transferase-like glycosyltransferase
MELKWKWLNAIVITLLLVTLLVVISKEKPNVSVHTTPLDTVSVNGSVEVVNLSENRIVLFSADVNSRNYGDLIVLEFDEETQSLKEISNQNIFLDKFFD